MIAVVLTAVAAVTLASYADGWFRSVWLYVRPFQDHGLSLIREPGWLLVVHEFGMGSLMQMSPGASLPPRFAFYYEPVASPTTPTVNAFVANTVDLGLVKLNIETNRSTLGADALIVRHELVAALALVAAGLAWLSCRRSVLKRRAAERRCLHCGYDLRGQADNQTACPECGESPLAP